MPTTQGETPEELLRRAIISLDAQIAELQMRRTQLAALVEPDSAIATMAAAVPRQPRHMSAEARARISAAAKARWAQKKTQAKQQPPKPLAKKAKPVQKKKAATKKDKAKTMAGTAAK